MDQLISPDIPAWLAYLLVLSLGMLVARANINRLLTAQPGHWGFWNTWVLFWANSAIPVALFWFLDYTSAIKDTALFGALVVAFGYRQIFAGGVQGITMVGQTPRLWQPFEAWVNRIKEQIATEYTDKRGLFDARVRAHLASDAGRMNGLRELVFTYAQDPAALAASLAALNAQAAPVGAPAGSFAQWKNNEEVRRLLDDLRQSQPVNYGSFLYEKGLITRWMSLNWRQSRRSQWAGWIVTLLVAATLAIGAWFCFRNERIALSYYQWRLTKPGVSDRDRFRSRENLIRRLKTIARDAQPGEPRISAMVLPLVGRLRFRSTTPQTAQDILDLFADAHSIPLDRAAVPDLIEALRNPNEDLRLRIRRTLSGLQEADFPKKVPDKLAQDWVPAKDESPFDMDRHVQAWQEWWRAAQEPSPAPSP
ncbi:MAG: hypothetical protein ACRD2R_03635 [Terriglobales bacterium]